MLYREARITAAAGRVGSSLRSELWAIREALALVSNLSDSDLASINRIRHLTDSRSGLQLLQ